MRPKIECQTVLDFQPSNLKLTNDYFEKYQKISNVLDANPRILDLAHEDLKDALANGASSAEESERAFTYTSDMVLRAILCRKIEGMSFREITVRIDDSQSLRCFVRIYDGPMMDYSMLNRLENSIRPETWKKINKALAKGAVKAEFISGELLRADTTAVETNIHYPTDSSLLWDVYRVLARQIEKAREIDPNAVGSKRLHKRRAKHLHVKISRNSGKKKFSEKKLKKLYKQLLEQIASICTWCGSVVEALKFGVLTHKYNAIDCAVAEYLVEQMEHYIGLAARVFHQTRRRIVDGEKVPNNEKMFSIFEPHTELLVRGKAGKNVEFGHMIIIQQVVEKFITEYDVFEKRPLEYDLVDKALKSHKDLFGQYPDQFAADKAFYKNMETIKGLEKKVKTVAIGKKGKRSPKELERELDPLFRHAQRFRAGLEGTISFLKRVLRLFRITKKGWKHFVAEVGATVFAHNLLVLARV